LALFLLSGMAMKPLSAINNKDFLQPAYLIIAFIVVYILSVLIHLNHYPLNGEEPRRAVVAIEMLNSGNYIRPTTLGWEYYNKPPVYNWLISFCMWVTGSSSEFAVRLPSLIVILLWGFCNYHIVKKILSREIALLSSLFLLTSLELYFWGLSNGGEIDIFYGFIVYLQVIFIFYFHQRQKWAALFTISYLFCAIGFLTKGFPSIIFQALTLSALCAFNKNLRVVFRWQHLLGIALFTAIIGTYLYAYSFYSSPRILLADLLKESFNKSAFGEHSERFVSKALGYPLAFARLLLPWGLLLLLLFKKRSFPFWSNPFIRFSVLFILFNIPVYWLTGNPKMRYVYMFIPFCMIAAAYLFYHYRKEYPELLQKISRYSVVAVVVALAGLFVIPFLVKVNLLFITIAAVICLLFILVNSRKASFIVSFVSVMVLLRLVYAIAFIPIRYEYTRIKYDKEMAIMASANNFQPLTIYRKPDTLKLQIDLKLVKLNFGTIPTIPHIAYQMPYYYYKNSGQVVKYDTVLQENKNYIGYKSTLEGANASIIYSFRDKNQRNEEVVLFTIPGNPQTGIQTGPVKSFIKQ
jgi:4-amino-4-deoxy-L-arabinose transferase-like glycosyltransferase